MKQIVLKVRYSVKERLCRMLRNCRNAGTRLRYLMIVNVINGRSTRLTAKVLHVHHTTVGRVVQRFHRYGEADCKMAEPTTAGTSSAKVICSACIPLSASRPTFTVGGDRPGPANC